jgi:hypothetical protein
MRRWSKADQDPFILSVFLNPYIRCRLFNPDNPSFCVSALYTVAKRVFERVFQRAPDSRLFEAFISYYHWKDEFSMEQWHLEEYSTMYGKDVSVFACLSNVLISTHRLHGIVPQDKEVNLLALWSALPFPGTSNTGRHQLACLAKLLLSVVANSAGAERLFSRMGNIHTKRRNRLHYEKVHDIATVAMDLDAQHQATGISRKRTRRHFDEAAPQAAPIRRADGHGAADSDLPSPDPSDTDSNADDNPLDEAERAEFDLTALAAQLIRAVNDDEDDAEEDGDGPYEQEEALPDLPALAAHQPGRQPRVRLFFGTAHAIPLNEVFNFSESIPGLEDGLDVFWKCGIRNLAKERSVYEAVAHDYMPKLSNN